MTFYRVRTRLIVVEHITSVSEKSAATGAPRFTVRLGGDKPASLDAAEWAALKAFIESRWGVKVPAA